MYHYVQNYKAFVTQFETQNWGWWGGISIKQVTSKQSPSSFSNSNDVIPPIMLYYAFFFFASVVTQKSVKNIFPAANVFSSWKAFRTHVPTLPFPSIHYGPISKILFPQIFFTYLANFLISIFLTDGAARN